MVCSISALQGSAGAIAEYYSGAAGYYAAESEGQWWGGAAAGLGLSGKSKVRTRHFERLLGGLHPHRAEPLVPTRKSKTGGQERVSPGSTKTPRDRAPGFDLTFSCEKSVTVLWAVSDAADRKKIEACMSRSVTSTLEWFEEHVTTSRSGKGGSTLEFAKLVAARYVHVVNRSGEAQLHEHVVLPNVALCKDGKYRTLDSRQFHRWARSLGPIFRQNLGAELQREFGLELSPVLDADGKTRGWFRLAGVPEALCKAWSSRRAEIEKLAGIGASAGARQAANLKTRKKKDKQVDHEKLLEDWVSQAKALGFTGEVAKGLRNKGAAAVLEDVYAAGLKRALEKLTSQESHFSERTLIEALCEELVASGIPAKRVTERLRRDLEQSPEIVRLPEVKGERQFTTRELFELEKRLLGTVEAMKARPGARVSDRTIERVIRSGQSRLRLPGKPKLSAEQAEAVRKILSGKGAIRLMQGAAGTGKSTTISALRQGLERSGYTVIGGALSGAAKEELSRASKVPSRTVESYLYHLDESYRGERLKNLAKSYAQAILRSLRGQSTRSPTKVKIGKKHVLILDEAAMIDTPTMAKILGIAQKAKATVILVGDDRQLQSIGPGGLFSRLRGELDAASLSTNRRQKDPQDRAAVEALRSRDAAKALENYASRGRVTVAKDRAGAIEELVSTWVKEGGARSPKDHVIVTELRAERDEINRRCQQARLRGKLFPRGSVKHGSERFYVGDRVAFHRPLRPAVENGYSGKILAIDPFRKVVTIRLDQAPSREAKKLGARRTVRIPLRKLREGDISLGYAGTAHKLQGSTCKNAYVLTGSNMTNAELAYVQATRASGRTRIFVDELSAGETRQDLAKQMNLSRQKIMAHDVGRENGQVLSQELRLTPDQGKKT